MNGRRQRREAAIVSADVAGSNPKALFGGLLRRVSNPSDATHVARPHGALTRYGLPVGGDPRRLSLKTFTTPIERVRLQIRRAWGPLTGAPSASMAPTALFDAVAGFADQDVRNATVRSGGWHCDKPAVLFLDQAGEPVVLAKVAVSDKALRFLRWEADWLKEADRTALLIDSRPTVIGTGTVKGAFVLLETVGRGRLIPYRSRATQVHLEFLSTLQSSSPAVAGFRDSPMHSSLKSHFAALSPMLPQAWIARAARTLKILESEFRDAELPMVRAHGDFTPWNIRRSEAGLFVFDWELARNGCVPLLDLYHYMLMPRAHRGRLSVVYAFEAISTVRALGAQLPDGDQKSQQVGLQLLAYLLDRVLHILDAGGSEQLPWANSQFAPLIDAHERWILR